MKIEVRTVGLFREVGFFDYEDAERSAHSGLLDAGEARELADQLRAIARRLEGPVAKDEDQFLLPLARAA